MFPDPGKPLTYPDEIRKLAHSAVKGAMEQCEQDPEVAIRWIEDDIQTYLSEWAEETSPDNVDYRAALLAASWIGYSTLDFFIIAHEVGQAATRIGPETQGEVRTLVDDLKATGQRTGDWPLCTEILRKWLAPLCDE